MKGEIKVIYLRDQHDPAFNLAADEYFVRNLDTSLFEYLFIYRNTPTIVQGKNQNTYEEVNLYYCEKHGIDINRRLSGGGCVYHDPGNINFSWITSFETSRVNNYHFFNSKLQSFLSRHGCDTHLDDRNALRCGKLKIGGNAQFTDRKNILSHNTLLFDSQLDHLNNSIDTVHLNIDSNSSKSVRSSVTNVSDEINKTMSIDEFIYLFIKEINAEEIELSPNDLEKIGALKLDKFDSEEWRFGRSPNCKIELGVNDQNFRSMQIEKGMLEEFDCGDELYTKYLNELSTSILSIENIANITQQFNIKNKTNFQFLNWWKK